MRTALKRKILRPDLFLLLLQYFSVTKSFVKQTLSKIKNLESPCISAQLNSLDLKGKLKDFTDYRIMQGHFGAPQFTLIGRF